MGLRRGVVAALSGVSLMLLPGCAVDPGPGDAAPPGPTVPEQDPVPETEQGPDEGQGGVEGPAPQGCTPDTLAAIGATVSAQLDAFAQDDLPLAYAMTSPFFRRLVAPDDFATLIRDDYPELVGNDGHRLDACGSRGRRGFLIVGVQTRTQEVVLRYDLSEEDDGWRIDGARRLTDVMLPERPLA